MLAEAGALQRLVQQAVEAVKAVVARAVQAQARLL
jgi:hypothetical protein